MQTIQKLLHINAAISDYNATKLPLYLKNAYQLSLMQVAGVTCLLAKPVADINLASLRKQRVQLSKQTALECVLYFEKTSPYIKRKLSEEGIPFIIEGKDVYLPFLGIVLSQNKERALKKAEKINDSTQRLLLTALYHHWDKLNLSETAKALDVSKMTISRCFDQLQSVGLPLVQETDKERFFVWDGGPKALWHLIQPYLRNPVKREYRLDAPAPQGIFLPGGMSALSRYSLLNDNDYPTFAITASQEKEIALKDIAQVPEKEQPLALLQVMPYTVHFMNTEAVDPITAYLSLSESEQQDPRVCAALDDILEVYVFGQRN